MPARLGHQQLAAMVDISATVVALDSLLDNAVEEGATVVTPGGLVIGGGLELVRAWLLHGEGGREGGRERRGREGG